MRYKEINTNENITTVQKESQLLKWLTTITQYLDTFDDNYLLYKTFYTGILSDKRPITKINNVTHTPKKVTTAGNQFQEIVLNKLGIKNPVFCKLKVPENISGDVDPYMKTKFLGNPYILIPPQEYKMFWSPVVYDLGAFYINAPKPQSGRNILDPEKVEDYIDTYQQGWPTRPYESFTENEIILDAKYYYILNVESVISIIGDIKTGDWGDIDKESYLEKLTTYSDLSEFIKNNIQNIKNMNSKVLDRSKRSEKRNKDSFKRNKKFIMKKVAPIVQSIDKDADAETISAQLQQAGVDEYVDNRSYHDILINILKSMGFQNADQVNILG